MVATGFFRAGAAAAMAGGILGFIFNLLHPRSGDALGNVEAELQLVAESGIWKLDHVMLMVALVLASVGFIVIALSMAKTAADLWARAAALFGTGSAAVTLVLVTFDGLPMKDLADRWAAGDEAVTGAATALVEMNVALLGVSFIVLFGITPLLFGQALLASGIYPANLGYAEIVGGVLGLITGFLVLFDSATSLTGTILIPLSSLIHTVVVFVAAWLLWNRAETIATPIPELTTTSSSRV